ncbi:MAG: type IV toxin-antitoxin system AbiEi family antitoxin domain-containing protein [Actinomycetota bacterium]|nr:type IV toxin-antitoxin system AbiEi family antitoxin domain-containing protein [Actinomycetota bacterium]
MTRAQLIAAGVGETGIEERVRTHRLLRLHRGVYALGHRELKGEGHWMAAVLACGPGAVLSHASAAAHWNIRVSASSYVDVTVPTRAGRMKRKGLRIHRSGRLGPTQVTMHEGIPVTTLARTLLDLADILNLQGLKRAIHEADYLRLLDMTALIEGYEVDFVWPEAKLIVETDGFAATAPATRSKPTASATAASAGPAFARSG